jgi:hypothetical protein
MITPLMQSKMAAESRPTNDTQCSDGQHQPEATEQHLRLLPKESAVVLMCFGIVDLLFLDPVGVFFVLSGVLAFTPRLFQRTERWVQSRYPRIQKEGRRHIDRFIDSFETRFPPDAR